MKKYIELHSLTFWSSATPIAAGAFIAFEPVHGMTEYVQSVSSMFGDVSPAILINGGLIGLGIVGRTGGVT